MGLLVVIKGGVRVLLRMCFFFLEVRFQGLRCNMVRQCGSKRWRSTIVMDDDEMETIEADFQI